MGLTEDISRSGTLCLRWFRWITHLSYCLLDAQFHCYEQVILADAVHCPQPWLIVSENQFPNVCEEQ